MIWLSLSRRHRSFSCPDPFCPGLPAPLSPGISRWRRGLIPAASGGTTCAVRWPTQGLKLGEPLPDLIPTRDLLAHHFLLWCIPRSYSVAPAVFLIDTAPLLPTTNRADARMMPLRPGPEQGARSAGARRRSKCSTTWPACSKTTARHRRSPRWSS